MELSKYLKQYLTSELRNVASKIGTEGLDPPIAAYWYSAAFGATQRALNLEYNDELVFLYSILIYSHSQIAQPQSRAALVQIEGKSLFVHLGTLIGQLAEAIECDAEYSSIVVSIAAAAYMATGNGFYLWSSNPMNELSQSGGNLPVGDVSI